MIRYNREMQEPLVHIIGIDCAVQDKRVGLAFGVFNGESLEVRFATPGRSEKVLGQVEEWINPKVPTLLAIDAPLGWPTPLGKTLVNHQAGQPIIDEANLLFRRETDREIRRRLQRQPLDVGADRIARTAHRALEIIWQLAAKLGLREIPLAWAPDLRQGVWAIEVYPAATLIACPIPIKGYKDVKKGMSERRDIVKRLRGHLHLPGNLDAGLVGCVDTLDAVVCLLAGVDFLIGRAVPPLAGQQQQALKEGWIWCRERTVGS
jgi:predicted RNase H-like nuclease